MIRPGWDESAMTGPEILACLEAMRLSLTQAGKEVGRSDFWVRQRVSDPRLVPEPMKQWLRTAALAHLAVDAANPPPKL